MKTIDVVIVNYLQSLTVIKLVKELIKEEIVGQVVVVDNSEDKGEAKRLKENLDNLKVKIVISEKNLGFGTGCNVGFKYTKSDYVAFVNPDVKYMGGLDKILDLVRSLEADVAGAVMVDKGGNLIPTAGYFPKLSLKFWRYFLLWVEKINHNINCPTRVDWVSGAFMVVKRGVFETLGGFDEKFKLYYEDLDLCLRAKKNGYMIWYLPVKIVHLSHQSVKKNKSQAQKWFNQSRFHFVKKHRGLIMAMMDKMTNKIKANFG